MNIKEIIGASIVFILLGFYIYSLVVTIQCANTCASDLKCDNQNEQCEYNCDDAGKCATITLSSGISNILTTVGSLISALVIATLAITAPSSAPSWSMFRSSSKQARKPSDIILIVYLAVWVIAGVALIYFGWIQNRNVSSTLTELANSWFSLAVTAAFAYFGINPNTNP